MLPPSSTLTMSFSPFWSSFLLMGLFLMATVIFGVSFALICIFSKAKIILTVNTLLTSYTSTIHYNYFSLLPVPKNQLTGLLWLRVLFPWGTQSMPIYLDTWLLNQNNIIKNDKGEINQDSNRRRYRSGQEQHRTSLLKGWFQPQSRKHSGCSLCGKNS